MTAPSLEPPPQDTVERWAWDVIHTEDLETKLSPPPPPRTWESAPPARRIARPGRPAVLVERAGRFRTPSAAALRVPETRARLMHAFLHHELQAAELLCWAVLAFADSPARFRAGLLAIARDELRHVGMYRAYLSELGYPVGAFSVRDWFWERVPGAATPAQFVATLGVGFEGANLDHAARFAQRFDEAGDPAGAALQTRVGTEEIAHVRFALHWLQTFTGRDGFADWVAQLPAPLSPMVMRGAPLDRAARERAGLSPAFIDELEAWQPRAPGS